MNSLRFHKTVTSRLVFNTIPDPPQLYEPESVSVTDRQVSQETKWEWRNGIWQPDSIEAQSLESSISNNLTLKNGKLSYFFDLPELAAYVGLPVSIYVAVSVTFGQTNGRKVPDATMDRNGSWSLTLDVGDWVDVKQTTPQSLTVTDNVAHFAMWLYGLVKSYTGSPRIRVEADTFWLKDIVSPSACFGSVIGSHNIEIDRSLPPDYVAGCVKCRRKRGVAGPPFRADHPMPAGEETLAEADWVLL